MRRRVTRRSGLLVVFAMIAGLLAATVGTASAGTPAVTVSQTSNLLNGQVVTVNITADVTAAGHFYAVTQCGNADQFGNPIAPGNQGDCAGQPVLGTGLRLVSDAGVDFGALPGPITTGTTYSVALTLIKQNIGANGAQCVPVGGAITNPCTIAVAESDAGQVTYGQVAVPITYRPGATVVIDSVTGQTGNQAARAGDTINISGINWDGPNASLTAELCNVALTSCDAAGVSGTVSTTAGGNLSGALLVDGSATAGARALKVTDGTQTASKPIQILGARTITLSPAAGGIGTNVTVNGSGFDASATVALSQTDGVGGLGAPTITAASATGAVNGVVTISDLATIGIGATELDGLGAPIAGTEAFAAFSASGNACTVPAGGECSVLETVTLVVNPGTLSLEQADNQVTMSPITLDGTTQTSTGDVQALTINDARGSLVGWSVTAIMTDLTGPGGTNSTIAAGNMTTVTPTCVAVDGSATGITAGADAQAFDPVTRVTLCTAAVGEGGGTYAANSGLSLIVPSNIRSGTYTATLTILLA